MILDREKTMEALKVSVLESMEEHSITADNLDEIQLVIIDKGSGFEFVMVENDHGTQFDLDELSDGELLIFCSEYEVQAIYDIDESVKELKDYLVSQIKPFEYKYEFGKPAVYVHRPDNVEDIVKVLYVDDENYVCVEDLHVAGGTEQYHLSSLYIDDLLEIIKTQRNGTNGYRISIKVVE